MFPSTNTIRTQINDPEDGIAALAAALWGQGGRPQWHDRAACAGTGDDEEWFDKASASREWRLNSRYCSGCPVRSECANDILTWEKEVTLGAGIVTGHAAGMNATTRRERLKSPERTSSHANQDHHAA